MAEMVEFGPTIEFSQHTLSKSAPLTARKPPHVMEI